MCLFFRGWLTRSRIKFTHILKYRIWWECDFLARVERGIFSYCPHLYSKCFWNTDYATGVLEILLHTDCSGSVYQWAQFQAVWHWASSKSFSIQRIHKTGNKAACIHFIGQNTGDRIIQGDEQHYGQCWDGGNRKSHE